MESELQKSPVDDNLKEDINDSSSESMDDEDDSENLKEVENLRQKVSQIYICNDFNLCFIISFTALLNFV